MLTRIVAGQKGEDGNWQAEEDELRPAPVDSPVASHQGGDGVALSRDGIDPGHLNERQGKHDECLNEVLPSLLPDRQGVGA